MFYRPVDLRELRFSRIKTLTFRGIDYNPDKSSECSPFMSLTPNEVLRVYLGCHKNCLVAERSDKHHYGVVAYEFYLYKAKRSLFSPGEDVCEIMSVRRGCGTGNYGEGTDDFIIRLKEGILLQYGNKDRFTKIENPKDGVLIIDGARFDVEHLYG